MPRSRDETRIYNKNKFKLGLFGMNCSGGLSLTKAPERWDASWDNNVTAARLALIDSVTGHWSRYAEG